QKFSRLGGKIPKGALLEGPPGTGKTLLARAIAGEAGVPFFTISGSDFVEMFVGVGASRVRDMFEQAKKNAPCIVFIDEIDAVGRSRGAGYGGGNDEREQTLNQLLVEMDGFEANEGVIIIAATNRKDVLDPALLRPGRFDRQVTVGNPDIKGREKILGVHARKTPLGPDVDLRIIARGTPGFSGADLANLVNEAALTAARVGRRFVAMMDFEAAKDKIMMGAERRSMVLTQDQKEKTAYHEAGHAIVGIKLPKCDPVYKATIIPRGGALGMVMSLPEMDKLQMFKDEAEQKIAMTMAGKAAEIFKYGAETVSSGPMGDIMQASQLARGMVMRMGMSDKVGNIDYSEAAAGYQANGGAGGFSVSAATKELIESEVKRIIDEGYDRAYKMITDHEEEFERLAQGLLEYETLTGEEIKRVMEGKPPQDPDGDDTSGMDKPSLTAIPKAKGKKTPPPSGMEPEPSV
ncbi:MAG TPA: cell division protein FtsH, partial [Sulfitobacter pontiacus]|nr:cell division protein FtsH [Sulfitobacter pontiacus]